MILLIGLDDIQEITLKVVGDNIYSPLSHIINIYFCKGTRNSLKYSNQDPYTEIKVC